MGSLAKALHGWSWRWDCTPGLISPGGVVHSTSLTNSYCRHRMAQAISWRRVDLGAMDSSLSLTAGARDHRSYPHTRACFDPARVGPPRPAAHRALS